MNNFLRVFKKWDEAYRNRFAWLFNPAFSIPRDGFDKWIWKYFNFLGFALILVLFLIQICVSLENHYFANFSLVEESAYTFTSASNFLKFGFLHSGLLQDFSGSQFLQDHPYVYMHMPAGPDIFTALLLRITSNSFQVTRIIFALIAVLGLIYYVKFGNLILSRNVNIRAMGFSIIFVGSWILIQTMERQIYSPFPFLLFFPLVSLQAYYFSEKKRDLWFAIAISLIASLYIEYSLLSAFIFCWIFLYITQLLRVHLVHLLGVLATIFFGICIHLIQNMLYLGPKIFLKEFLMTLSNRISGFPTQEAMKTFFETIGVVHHGSRPVQVGALVAQLKSNFLFPGFQVVGMLAIISLCWIMLFPSSRFEDVTGGHTQSRMKKFISRGALYVRMGVWLSGTLVAPILLFPAFAQEVNLQGMGANRYLIGIIITAVLGIVVRDIIEFRGDKLLLNMLKNMAIKISLLSVSIFRRISLLLVFPIRVVLSWKEVILNFSRIAVWLLMIFYTIIIFQIILTSNGQKFYQVYDSYRQGNWNSSLEELRQFKNHLFMTNINVVTPAFLVSHPGFGVCNQDSVKDNGILDKDNCKVLFARRNEYWKIRHPRYFFFFRNPALFPGFADCLPTNTILGSERGGGHCLDVLQNRLQKNFRLIFQNSQVWVYDLSKLNIEKNTKGESKRRK